MTPHRLTRYCGMAIATALVLTGISEATAQFLPMPGQASPATGQSNPFPPPPGPGQTQSQPQSAPSSAFPPPAGPSQRFSQPQRGPSSSFPPPPGEQSVCATFPAIREAAEKGANAIQVAGKRKAAREEVCKLFKSFAVKEGRMVSFMVKHQTTCRVPPDAIKQVKANRAQTLKIRNQVCNAAQAGPPPGPSLSDALGGPIVADDNATKSKGGTFNTLTGNALAR
jgi:hypothetical protein